MVMEVYPLPVASFSTTTVCENELPTHFTNLTTIPTGSISIYEWDFSDNGAVSDLPSPTHDYADSGIYEVSLIVVSNNGCRDTIVNPVKIKAKPAANFISDITSGCSPLCIQLQDNSIANSSSIVSYDWTIDNNITLTSEDPNICLENNSNLNEELKNVELIVTNDLGCSDTILAIDYLTVYPRPLASFEADPLETTIYEPEFDFFNLSEGGSSYFWNYGDSISSISYEEAHLYSDTGEFDVSLIVTSAHGCVDSTILTVLVKPVISVYIPNAFTPNSDGDNDTFFISGEYISTTNFEFMIFDRWGTLIYRTTEFRPWDGTYKNELVQQDAYIYKVSLEGSSGARYEYKGHVLLLK